MGIQSTLINEEGKVYGRLIVKRYSGRKFIGGLYRSMWLCDCSCGIINFPVIGNDLRSGKVRSCGCFQRGPTSRNTKQEIGNVYGKLTVIKYAGLKNNRIAMWECLCECGNKIITTSHSLRSGRKRRSCGCHRRANEIGKTYGHLLVESFAGAIKEKKGTYYKHYKMWNCLCQRCGNKTVVNGASLRGGETRSCGCLKKLPKGEGAFNSMFRNVKRGARLKGHEWMLSDEFVKKISKMNCFYCGIEPKQIVHRKGKYNGEFLYNGIDRVDNSIDYIESNVVPCCKQCNFSKRNLTQQDFLDWVTQIYEHSARFSVPVKPMPQN